MLWRLISRCSALLLLAAEPATSLKAKARDTSNRGLVVQDGMMAAEGFL
jgi:hypothetical protein